MNVPFALVIVGAGWLLVWTGLADPGGGLAGVLKPLLKGQGLPKSTKNAATAASVNAYAARLSAASDADALALANAQVAEAGIGSSAVVAFARAQLGERYVWAGAGPSVWDCSGLTMRAYEQIGIKLPHNAEAQRISSVLQTVKSPAPGDLVFFGRPSGHCGIYIGGGQMIHAPKTGDVVKISSVSAVAGARTITYRGPKGRGKGSK